MRVPIGENPISDGGSTADLSALLSDKPGNFMPVSVGNCATFGVCPMGSVGVGGATKRRSSRVRKIPRQI
jgi:hypothetical protein